MSMTYSQSTSNFQFFSNRMDQLRYNDNPVAASKMSHIGHIVASSAQQENNNMEFEYSAERMPTEILPIEMYQHWFRAIMEDDVVYANDLLNNSSPTERKRMLNGRFLFEIGHQSKLKLLSKQYGMTCIFERPLILAVMFKSGKMFELLVNLNVNVFNTENDGSNITHALIWAASHQEKHEEEFCTFYIMIMSRLGYNSRKRLLLMENNEGLRPLELAMRMTTFKLALQILETEGVYFKTQAQMGAHVCTWFDVTDYEKPGSHNRRHLSPLKFMTLLEKEHLARLYESGILKHPLFERWMHNKLAINVPYLIVWCLVRLVYTLLLYMCTFTAAYYTTQNSSRNSTNTTSNPIQNFTDFMLNDSNIDKTNVSNDSLGLYIGHHQVPCPANIFDIGKDFVNILRYITITFSGIIIVFDLIDAVYQITYRKKKEAPLYQLKRSGNFIVKTRFYRYCNFLLAVAVAIYLSTTLAGPEYLNITTKAYIAANILNVWSILFFIQFLPAFGYFVIIVQRMLKDMFNFLLLYLVLFFSFSQTFYSLFRMRGYCTEAFVTISWSLYSTFKVMLNMVDLTQYVQHGDLTDIAILHSTYIIIVPILLVNFLIALMSNSVAEVAENRHVIMKLQRLSAAILVEHRLRTILYPLYRLQKKHYFAVREERIYVECLIYRMTSNHMFARVHPNSRPNSI